MPAIELVQQFADEPLAAIIYTDIATDGMLAGPNVAAMAEMQAAVDVPVIASGGVTTANDVADWPRRDWPAASSAGHCTRERSRSTEALRGASSTGVVMQASSDGMCTRSPTPDSDHHRRSDHGQETSPTFATSPSAGTARPARRRWSITCS